MTNNNQFISPRNKNTHRFSIQFVLDKLELQPPYEQAKNKFFEFLFKEILESKIKSDFKPNNYIYFKSTNEINHWGKEFNDYFKLKTQIGNLKLTKEDKFEIETFKYYAGNISIQMNEILRSSKNIQKSEFIEKKIKVLSQGISKFELKDNVIVIRRFLKAKFNHKLKKGDTYIEKGFLSTSLNLSYRLDNKSEFRPIHNEVLMLLKVPQKTNACYIEQISKRQEYELLIQKGRRIKIEKNIKILSNRVVIGKILN